jgi:hypothetical protein
MKFIQLENKAFIRSDLIEEIHYGGNENNATVELVVAGAEKSIVYSRHLARGYAASDVWEQAERSAKALVEQIEQTPTVRVLVQQNGTWRVQ